MRVPPFFSGALMNRQSAADKSKDGTNDGQVQKAQATIGGKVRNVYLINDENGDGFDAFHRLSATEQADPNKVAEIVNNNGPLLAVWTPSYQPGR